MSFGSKEYQHRFYNSTNHKKRSAISAQTQVFPLFSNYSPQYSPLLANRKIPETNEQNFKARAEALRMNEQGWQGYQPKSYTADKNCRDYEQNAKMLEKFKKEAEEYRHRLRFGTRDYRYSLSRNEQSPNQAIYSELKNNPSKVQQLNYSMLQSPQVLNYYQELALKDRLDSYETEKNNIVTRFEIKDIMKKKKLKEYKKKFSRLKSEMKEEIAQKQKQQMQRSHRKEVIAIEKQNEKLENIQEMLSNLSLGLQRNAELINQSLKIKSQITQNQPLERKKQKINPQSPFLSKKIIQQEKQVFSQEEDSVEEVELPRITPKIVYTKKKLETQYRQLQKLKEYIKNTEFRVKRLKTN